VGFFSGRREKDKKEIVFEQVTDALFTERLAAAEKPIMLFLWSNTCPFCRKMAVNVKNVLQRHRELIAGLHAEAATVPGIAGALHLRGVPATAFFHHGRLVEFVGGFRPEAELDEIIEKHFSPTQ